MAAIQATRDKRVLDASRLEVEAIVGRLSRGEPVRQVERALTAQLPRREARRRLSEARDRLALMTFASRLNGTAE